MDDRLGQRVRQDGQCLDAAMGCATGLASAGEEGIFGPGGERREQWLIHE